MKFLKNSLLFSVFVIGILFSLSTMTNANEDFYKNFSDLQKSFKKFINQVPFYGFSVVCNDDLYLRKMMKEVVEEVLKENGLIVESTSKTNDIMVIKVGQHLFEGKISKVKKLK